MGAASSCVISQKFRLLGSGSRLALLLAGVTTFSAPAAAQTSAVDSIEQVSVTATRVQRDGYSAPTPTTVLGLDDINSKAPANIADIINDLPALAASITPRNTNVNLSTSAGMNLLNLRNLGINRTLVLVDGHRVAPDTPTGNIDINLLPQGLIQRVDVVTGGASADWGSDAVAGVVNFILDKEFIGFKGNVQAGETEYGDGQNILAQLTGGTSFGGGRGHVEASGSYYNQGSVGGAQTTGRPWYKGFKVLGNPNGSATDILLPNVGFSHATAGGLITGGPLQNVQFVGATGTPVANFSTGFISGQESVNGTAEDNSGQNIQLQNPQREGTIFARADYKLTPEISIYAEGNYARNNVVAQGVTFNRFANLTINSGNPYLDPGIQARMTALGLASFPFGTTNQALGPMMQHTNAELFDWDVGADGKLGDTWSWNARFEHGFYTQISAIQNDAIVSRYSLALDAVRDPATGSIVCRDTLTNPTDGCIPLNAFGTGQVSAATRNYVTGTSATTTGTTQNDFTINIQGEPFSLWAGPVSIASGYEYRQEKYTLQSTALDQANVFFIGNQTPAIGSYDVNEGFVETVIPLLAGVPLAKELDFNGAIRATSYSASGMVATWKLGLTDDVSDELKLRVTRSTDIRAPNLQDLYATGLVSIAATFDPQTGTSPQVTGITSGNPNLVPETANTTSGGAVYTPSWVPGLTASVDYFKVNISNAIIALNALQVVQQCYVGVSAACSLVTRNAGGALTQVRLSPVNAQYETTAGLDFAVNYYVPLEKLADQLPGSVNFKGLATNTWDRRIIALGATTQYAGTNGDGAFADPRWRGLVAATYDLGNMSATLTARYVGSGVISYKTPVIVNNAVSSTTYLDLSGAYAFTEGWQAYFIVNNLADQSPPPTPQVTVLPHQNIGANDFVYDVLGRQFRVGVRFQY